MRQNSWIVLVRAKENKELPLDQDILPHHIPTSFPLIFTPFSHTNSKNQIVVVVVVVVPT